MKQQLQRAVREDPLDDAIIEQAFAIVLPVLRTVWRQLPWYEKILATAKALIQGIEWILERGEREGELEDA